MDQSKKTMRHFYCRDVLWETFEQMANDFDCSIDYLVNEAMRYYARSKNYQSPGAGAVAGDRAAAVGSRRRPCAPGAQRPERRLRRATPAAPVAPARAAPMPPPAPPATGTPRRLRDAAPPTPSAAPPPRPAAPRRRRRRARAPRRAPQMRRGGRRCSWCSTTSAIPIDKDQFIIGRGSKTSDLPIKDGNISRKHAAVIRRNGTFYIKDLGSTNGIDYKGMRIDNKRIDEGDVFHLCDYELRFTYR